LRGGVEPFFGTSNRGYDLGLGPDDEARHDVTGAVASPDLPESNRDLKVLAIRSSGHICIPECIGNFRVLTRELRCELRGKPTLGRLQMSTRMMRYERGHTLIKPLRA
jgi:hypothetical protein